MEVRFCPKCHKEAFRLVTNEKGYQVIQNGKTLANLGDNSSISMSIGCQFCSRPVKLEIGKETVNER